MKIVVIGGTGLIGGKAVELLRAAGHEVVAAAPSSGVNTITGEGLAEALAGAQAVLDVANSPSFADAEVLEFFTTSERNLVAAAAEAGVQHHVALSVVGADRLPESGYMRAKVAQEELITSGPTTATIVRATQFHEFAASIAAGGTDGDTVTVSTVQMQPIAAADVSAVLAEVVAGPATGGIVEIAGPEQIRMDAFVRRVLTSRSDPRAVIGSEESTYFGAPVDDKSLVPLGEARLGATTLDDWLAAGN